MFTQIGEKLEFTLHLKDFLGSHQSSDGGCPHSSHKDIYFAIEIDENAAKLVGTKFSSNKALANQMGLETLHPPGITSYNLHNNPLSLEKMVVDDHAMDQHSSTSNFSRMSPV